MKKELTKNKVATKLLKCGFNENDVIKMINKNFEYAFNNYNTLKSITNRKITFQVVNIRSRYMTFKYLSVRLSMINAQRMGRKPELNFVRESSAQNSAARLSSHCFAC